MNYINYIYIDLNVNFFDDFQLLYVQLQLTVFKLNSGEKYYKFIL